MTEKRGKLQPGWKPGQSGNPRGKPKGARNKSTLLAIATLEADIPAIAKVVADAAKGGNLQAARIVLERLIPPTRERPVSLALPDTTTTEGIKQAQSAILAAVAEGELTPGEGTALSGIVEQHRKAIETQELEQRIAALEREGAKK